MNLRSIAAQIITIATFTAIAYSVVERSPTPAFSLKLHTQKKILPAAPWSKPALSAKQVAPVFQQQWQQAGRKAACAAIAPLNLGKVAGAKPRSANFGSGAWAVAYDKPGLPGRKPDGSFCANCGRGAFGIAGTSVDASAPQYQGFPYQRRWADGSQANYGLSGGTSLPYLAYLTVANQRCLYNVWSFLGREHLEYFLEQLRFVKATV